MIRTFRLYHIEKLERVSLNRAKERLQTARLNKLVNTTPSRLSRVLHDLADNLKSERLDGPRNRPGHWEIILHGKWPARRATVAPGPPPRLPVEVTIWLRKASGWLVVFEASRALCDAAVYLTSDALSGSVEAASSVLLGDAHWTAVAAWLGRAGGDVLGGKFYKTKASNTDLEWISLRRTPGSKTTLLDESFRNAEGIGELLIQTPHIDSIQMKLTCRIGRTGSVRVYGNEVSDGMVEALLLELESAWADEAAR